jgi:uncharacterized membrane protein YciS (DUF1049 family)
MATQVVTADGDYSAGTWIGTTFAVGLIFVVAAAVVALVWWLIQGRRASYKKALLDPVVPLSAVVITVGYQLIVHH